MEWIKSSNNKFIDSIFIKIYLKKTNNKYNIKDYICKQNIIFQFKSEEDIVYIYCINFYSNELKIFIETLINLNELNFYIHWIFWNKNINKFNIKVLNIFYDKEIKYEKKNYFCWDEFLNNHQYFKTILYDLKNLTKKEKVLIIKNFHSLKLNILKMSNLLCLFGNIKNIFFNYIDGTVYIRYEYIKSIQRLINNREKLLINGSKLEVNIKNLNTNNFIKKINFSSKLNIFNNSSLNIKYNSPSNTIMVCNIRVYVKMFKFYNIIVKYGMPLWIKFIYLKDKKRCKIALIKFKDVQEAINVLININNVKINGWKYKASFSLNKSLKSYLK